MNCVIAPLVFNVPVTTSGVYVSTRGGSLPFTLALPDQAKVLAWSLSTAPSSSAGGLYVSVLETGPTSSTKMATLVTLGRAIQLDVGEALNTPANLSGPFDLTLALTSVSGIVQARIIVWVIS